MKSLNVSVSSASPASEIALGEGDFDKPNFRYIARVYNDSLTADPVQLTMKTLIDGGEKTVEVFREVSDSELKPYENEIQLLEKSPIIQSALQSRLKARKLAAENQPTLDCTDARFDNNFYFIFLDKDALFIFDLVYFMVQSLDGKQHLGLSYIQMTGHMGVSSKDYFKISNLFEIVMAHELMHGAQFDVYGKQFAPLEINAPSSALTIPGRKIRHSVELSTDVNRAFYEGFAQAHERYFTTVHDIDFAASYQKFVTAAPEELGISSETQEKMKMGLLTMQMRKQTWIGLELMPFWNTDQLSENPITEPIDMVNSEGVVANFFYHFLTDPQLVSVENKIYEVFLHDKPASLMEFVEKFIERFPEDKEPALTIFQKQTLGVLVSDDAYNQYLKLQELEKTNASSHIKAIAKTTFENAMSNIIEESIHAGKANIRYTKPFLVKAFYRGNQSVPVLLNLNLMAEKLIEFFLQDLSSTFDKVSFKGHEKEQALKLAQMRRRSGGIDVNSKEWEALDSDLATLLVTCSNVQKVTNTKECVPEHFC